MHYICNGLKDKGSNFFFSKYNFLNIYFVNIQIDLT